LLIHSINNITRNDEVISISNTSVRAIAAGLHLAVGSYNSP